MTILGQDYLHLWNTPEIKERREKMLLYPQRYGPQILKPMFTTAKQKKERAKRLEAVTGMKGQPDIGDALKSLDIISEWGR